MKKKGADQQKKTKKLRLSRETLRELKSTEAARVKAALAVQGFSGETTCPGCDPG